MKKNNFHQPVLLDEVLHELKNFQGTIIDGTLGYAGHAESILENNPSLSSYYGFDQDAFAIEKSSERLQKYSAKVFLKQGNFKNITELAKTFKLVKVEAIFLDLGVSSVQLDFPERGFSYSQKGPLDMRMDQSQSLTAAEIINTYEENQLVEILNKNADVKLPQVIAKALIKNRPFENTLEVVELLRKVLPAKLVRQKNPAKTVFQALRIAVNDEFHALESFLEQALALLKVNGKLLIITFHSKEDKIVKDFFGNLLKNKYPSYLPINEEKCFKAKSYFAKEQEIFLNKRSRSAKLRVLTKLKEG